MLLRCPGYLNAKSLLESGDCREDYVEWFANPALTPYRKLIDSVYGSMQYRGYDPVLLVCDVSSESCLLFRFTMRSHDRKGRGHQRYEVMKVERPELPSLLNGEFKATPDERTKEFIVEGVEGADLPRCECHTVQNELFNVYTRNPKSYWFKSEEGPSNPSPQQQLTSDPGRSVCAGRTTLSRPKKGGKIMCKVLFALLIALCVLSGWKCCEEIKDLRSENSKLRAKINQFEEWTKTRDNFELNKVKLKNKFEEIIKNFREAEDMWLHMDEISSPASVK